MRTRSIVAILVGVTALFVFVGAAVFLLGGGDRQVGALNLSEKGESRSYASGKYILQTDGTSPQFLGNLGSYEGCRPKGAVAKAADAQGVIRKNVTGTANVACILHFGTSMEPAFWSLIADMAKGVASPRNFQLLSASFDNKVVSGIRIVDAVPVSFVVPQFDSATKDLIQFSLVLAPDSLEPLGSPVGAANAGGGGAKGTGKGAKALLSNFKFTLGTLPMTRVNKVGPFEVSLPQGGGSNAEVHISDFDVSMSSSDTPQVRNWFTDFVIQGNNGAAAEKTATLELLDASGSKSGALMTFTFTGVGIFDLYDSAAEASKDTIKRSIFSLYAEELNLTIAGGFPNSTQPAPQPGPQPEPQPEPSPEPPPPTETENEPPPEEGKTLAAPEEIKGSISGDREVELAWTSVEGAESYVILAAVDYKGEESKEGPQYNELAETKDSTIVIADLGPGTYLFVVRARAGESESENSKPFEIVVE